MLAHQSEFSMLPTQQSLIFQIPFILFSEKIVFLSSVLAVVMLHISICLLGLTPYFITVSCLIIHTLLTLISASCWLYGIETELLSCKLIFPASLRILLISLIFFCFVYLRHKEAEVRLKEKGANRRKRCKGGKRWKN